MGFFSNLFTLPGTSAANKANSALAKSAEEDSAWNRQYRSAISPLLNSMPGAINNATNALSYKPSPISMQRYNAPAYNMPNSPQNAYGGVSTPQLNINNLPDVYKPSAETLSAMVGSVNPSAVGKSVRDSYAMNAGDAYAERSGQINSEAMRRGLGGRQGGMSTLDTSAQSGLASLQQRMGAEGNLAGINAENQTQGVLSQLIGQREGLANQGYQNQFNQAQYQNNMRQQDFGNQMGLAGANQSWGQMDYDNKIRNIGQLRDWTLGDINNNNNTSLQEGAYNTNQQQLYSDNMNKIVQSLMALLSPSSMGTTGANNTWSQVGQNANNQMQQGAANISGIAGLFPNVFGGNLWKKLGV